MRKVIALSFILLLAAFSAVAQENDHRFALSVGWADQGFEHLCWHEISLPTGLLSDDSTIDAKQDYRYLQHWFLEGRFKPMKWLSLGVIADFSGVKWDNVTYSGQGKELSRLKDQNFYNIMVLPSVRFDWLNRKYVSLHSGVAAGLLVNTGSEVDFYGNKTELAPAFSLNTIGITGSYDRYFISLDLGGTFSMVGSNEIFLIGSRLLSISVGIKL